MRQWIREFYSSDDMLMFSGLLMSMIKMRLAAHFHHKLLCGELTLEVFRQAVFEVLKYVTEEQLPCTLISDESDLAQELSVLACTMEALSIADEDVDVVDSDEDVAGDSVRNPDSPTRLQSQGPSTPHYADNSREEDTKQTLRRAVQQSDDLGSTKQVQTVRKVLQQKPESAENKNRYHIGSTKGVPSSASPVPSSSTNLSALQGASSSFGTHRASIRPPSGNAYSRFTSRATPKRQTASRFRPAPTRIVKEPPLCKEKARAWLEQAKVDYQAAQDILQVPASGGEDAATETCKFPALVCFLCHEVVEKCLKGLLYIFVEDVAHNTMMCSNLVTLMHQFRAQGHKAQKPLHDACNDAVMVVSMYESKSRFPNFHNPPCAPAAVYLCRDAVEAFSAVSTFMEKLEAVQIVRSILGDLKVVPKPRFISAMKSTSTEGELDLLTCTY
jgi:HEPN domain-containing protein